MKKSGYIQSPPGVSQRRLRELGSLPRSSLVWAELYIRVVDMNKLWLLFLVLLAPLLLMVVVLQAVTTGPGLITFVTIFACIFPLVAFYGLAMQRKFFNKLFWRITMWLVALGLLQSFAMPFLYMTFGFPHVNAGDHSGMYEIYILSGILSIFSILICFGLYKYSEYVDDRHA